MKKRMIAVVFAVFIVLFCSLTFLGTSAEPCTEHDWGTFEEIRKASVFSEGRSLARCRDCGVAMQRTVPRTPFPLTPFLIGLGIVVLFVAAVAFLVPKRSGKTGRRHKKNITL